MGNLLQSIKEKYPSMTKSNKKIADLIIDNTDDFLNMTAVEIGASSDTSPASVVRFSRKMGFKSIEELKISAAKNIAQLTNSPPINIISSKGDSTKILIEKLTSNLDISVHSTLKNINIKDFDKAVEYISQAQCVYLYGIGASGLVAADLYHKLNRANVKAMYNADTHMALEFSYYTKKTDVVIVFSYSGMTKEVVLATEQSRKNGAKIIVITKSKSSKLTQLGDIVFFVPDLENVVRIGAISSKYSSMIISDLLFLSLVNKKYDEIEEGFIETSKLTAKLKTNKLEVP